MRGAGRGDHADGLVELLAVALFGAVGAEAGAGAGRLDAGAANQHDVGNVYRHLLRETAPRHVFLAAADVSVHAIDPLDDHLALGAQNSQHLAAHAVFAGDDFHDVVDSNVHHTTSLARLTI